MTGGRTVATGRLRWRLLAVALAGSGVLFAVTGGVLAVLTGFTGQEWLTSFLATNGLMGVSFSVSGLLIAYHRRRNPVGWLLIGDGLGHAVAALLAPLGLLLLDHGAPTWLLRALSLVFSASWSWSIALFLPMVLLLFPDGHLPGRRWRWAAAAVVVTSPLFVLETVTDPTPLSDGLPSGYLTGTLPDSLSWVWTVSEARTSAALLLGLVSLVVRYRRSDEVGRRQLLWLLLTAVIVLAAVLPWSFVAGTPVVVLFSIPLVPAAIAIAVLRHQLLDIRLVVARAVAWLLLSVVALVAYVALVAALDVLVSRAFGRSPFAPVVVVVLAAPLLPRLQREVERWVYGDRRDPARVAGRLGEHLAAGDPDGLVGVVAALRSALRLPFVAVADADGVELAADGARPATAVSLPLTYAGERVGELEVGLRAGERRLAPADTGVLRLVSAPLSVALGALRLSADLQASRGRLVVAREEERRRLRRDLHDGLGPALTGIALSADAAANFLDVDPERSQRLLTGLRDDVRGAIADVRRLVDDLRPPALDEVGLVGAIRQRADQLRLRADGSVLEVRLLAPEVLPPLPAAVEVAAYRITAEALTNVVRHAGATRAQVQVSCNGALDIEVTDDGAVASGWVPGVGLASMRERADEVGGTIEVGPSARGGRVHATFPLEAL